MWLRWVLIAAAFVVALAVMGIFITGDSECRNWQESYTVVYEEMAGRTGPIVPSQIIEETNRLVGDRPDNCAVPQPLDQ